MIPFPDCEPVAVTDLVPPMAVYSPQDRVFLVVAANPPVHLDDDILVTYEGGIIAPLKGDDDVTVAKRLADADRWNRARSAEDVELYDWAGDGDWLGGDAA